MSATSITGMDRVAALQRFGYTEPEASFLSVAALHAGYFLRRQFAQFVGCRDGGSVTQLAHKVLRLGHARTSTWRQNTHLYHLCARPLYDALGEPDNRNRRPHEWAQVKNRIMGLDFVLGHRDVRFLVTEREKLDYFTGAVNIEPTKLPAKVYCSATSCALTRRYFVDKYPVFLSNTRADGGPPCVSFCFVDEGSVSLSRFESYLALYRPLFESLPGFHLIFVAAKGTHFAGARAMFERFRAQAQNNAGSDSRLDIERLLTYFRLRGLYEMRQFTTFDRSQLIQLRDARDAFSGRETDALYLTWRTRGDDVIRERLAEKGHILAPVQGTFSTRLLTHDYGLFGNLLLQ